MTRERESAASSSSKQRMSASRSSFAMRTLGRLPLPISLRSFCVSKKKERKQTRQTRDGTRTGIRVPTCTSRILQGRSGTQGNGGVGSASRHGGRGREFCYPGIRTVVGVVVVHPSRRKTRCPGGCSSSGAKKEVFFSSFSVVFAVRRHLSSETARLRQTAPDCVRLRRTASDCGGLRQTASHSVTDCFRLRQTASDRSTWSTWSAVINLTSRAGELRSAPSGPDDRHRVTG